MIAKTVENICHKNIHFEGKAEMIIRLLVSAANFGAYFPGDLEGNISENIPTTLSMPQVVQWKSLTKLSITIHL